MYLLDTCGNVHTDDSPVNDDTVVALRRTRPTLVLIPEYSLLYRYEENGDLTVVYIGGEKFQKVCVSLFGMHVYQDTREYIDESVRIVPFGDKQAQVYTGPVVFVIPEELLTLW